MGVTPGQREQLDALHDDGVTADGVEITSVTPSDSGLMRVTVLFRVAAGLRVVINDGSTSVNMDLNGGSNLSAGVAYILEFDCIGGYSYSFRPNGAGPNVDQFVVTSEAY